MAEIVKTKRLFFGIPLSGEMSQFMLLMQRGNANLKDIRWIPEHNLHITVHFFSDVATNIIPKLIIQLKENMVAIRPFTLTFQKFVLAPKRNPRMIWGLFLKDSNFIELQSNVQKLSIGADDAFKEVKIHVTLARFKYLKGKDSIQFPLAENKPVQLVNQINLYASELKPEGAIYSVIKSFPLS